MRIARVALSFFSIGFLAGSLEQAAGLSERAVPAAAYAAARASLALPEGLERAAPAPAGKPKPQPEAPHAAGDAALAPKTAVRPRKPHPLLAHLPHDEENTLGVSERSPAAPPREFILPFEKGRVTSLFNQGRRHPAIDLAGPHGTPVYATTRRQRVTFAGWRGGYGNLVIASDPQGRQHYYGHLHRIVAAVGAVLEQGETLGLLGTTGRSTGPHVHYEVRSRGGRHLDPSGLLFGGRPVKRGHAWNAPRPFIAVIRLAARSGQPRPR